MFRRRNSSQSSAQTPAGVVLGRRLAGGLVLPASGGDLIFPYDLFRRHVVVAGASGSGKTETVMRLANGVASGCPDAPIFYLDAKGDRDTAERFVGLMNEAGRRVRVFPNERFDAWRGDAQAIINRLLAVKPFVEEGPAAYYRDIAKTALQLVCNMPEGPPRSSAQFLSRLHLERLDASFGDVDVKALIGEHIHEVRMRYEAFFGQVGSLFDGGWSWEDTDAAYFLLDSMAFGEDAASAAAVIFADFAHYFTLRKPRLQFCVMFVDEFSSLASRTDMAVKVEQARVFNTGLVLVPQVVSGMGSLQQRDRILGSVETVVVHAMNAPEEILELAGTKRVPELSYRFDGSPDNREGFVRHTDRPKIDANRVREQQPGFAWVIRRGRAGQLQVYRAPEIAAKLPQAESAEPLARPRPPAPRHAEIWDRCAPAPISTLASALPLPTELFDTPLLSQLDGLLSISSISHQLPTAAPPPSNVAPKHLDIYDDPKEGS